MTSRSTIFASIRFAVAAGVLSLASAFAGEIAPAPAPAARPTDPAVQAWLEKRLAVWQDRLQLEHWAVTVRVCQGTELRPNTLGNIKWDMTKKTAVIRVLDPVSPAGFHETELSHMERTIVHELMHLELAALPKADETRGDEEQAVVRLADAFLALDRAAK